MVTVQLMVLPPVLAGGPPQLFLDSGGIWRDATPLGVAAAAAYTDMRQSIEHHLAKLMARVGAIPAEKIDPRKNLGFNTPFRNLFSELLPPEVRDELNNAAEAAAPPADPPLLNIFLGAGTDWIPWELLHDGKSFLGLRFAIARLPIVRQATEVRGPRARVVNSVYNLLARDVLSNGNIGDWEKTFEAYGKTPTWQHRFPTKNGDENYPTLNQLDEAKQADIVHLTCHGGLRDDTEYFWTLDHQNPQWYNYRITSALARSTPLLNRPLVFGNACASTATQAKDLGVLHGFGASFMIAGALNFVGTFAPITRTTGVTFAKRFYEQLFGSADVAARPIGQALCTTKRSFEDHEDPSYLFYCLYGPPDSTYAPA